jgi:hypothetical protein
MLTPSSFTAVRTPSFLVGIVVAQTDMIDETNFVSDYGLRPRNVCVCKLTHIFISDAETNGCLCKLVFGVNVQEVNPQGAETWTHFVIGSVALTVPTLWILVALQCRYIFGEDDMSFWKHLCWPYYLVLYFFGRRRATNRLVRQGTSSVTTYFGVI